MTSFERIAGRHGGEQRCTRQRRANVDAAGSEYQRVHLTSRFEQAKAGQARLTMLYAVKGEGSRMYDLDANVRLDFYNNATSLIFGHAYPPVVAAICDQASKGTAFAIPTEPEVELAQLLTARLPSVEQIRFTNSGTEAVLFAIRAARVFTGRGKSPSLRGAITARPIMSPSA